MIRLRDSGRRKPHATVLRRQALAMREPQSGYYIVEIVGRVADGATLDFTLDPPKDGEAKKPDWIIQGDLDAAPPDAETTARGAAGHRRPYPDGRRLGDDEEARRSSRPCPSRGDVQRVGVLLELRRLSVLHAPDVDDLRRWGLPVALQAPR